MARHKSLYSSWPDWKPAAWRIGPRHRTCQFPYGNPGDPGFHFCGAPVEMGRSYCPHHCAVCFRPLEEAA